MLLTVHCGSVLPQVAESLSRSGRRSWRRSTWYPATRPPRGRWSTACPVSSSVWWSFPRTWASWRRRAASWSDPRARQSATSGSADSPTTSSASATNITPSCMSWRKTSPRSWWRWRRDFVTSQWRCRRRGRWPPTPIARETRSSASSTSSAPFRTSQTACDSYRWRWPTRPTSHCWTCWGSIPASRLSTKC